jgi:hypothetical protein
MDLADEDAPTGEFGIDEDAPTSEFEVAERRVDPATGEVLAGSSPSTRDVDLEPGDAGSIELDFDPLAERKARSMPAPAPAPQRDGTAAAPAADPSTEQLDKQQVDEIAGFGSPPDGIINALPYMLAVRKRRGILRRAIADLETQHAKAREDLDKDLLRVGNRKFEDIGDDDEGYGPQVSAIRKAQSEIDAFRSERSLEEQDMAGKESYVDEEIQRLQAEADRYKTEEEAVSREVDEATLARKRVQLRLQRVDIEMRNLKAQIPKPGKDEPAPDPALVMQIESKLSGLKEVRDVIQGELDEADAEVKGLNRKLALARSAVSEQMGKVSLVEKKKTQLAQARKVSDQVSQGRFYELQSTLDGQLRDLALKCLAANDIPLDLGEMKNVLESKTASVEELERKRDLHRLAIDSYSHPDYVKGLVMLGGIAFMGFVLLILLLAIIL